MRSLAFLALLVSSGCLSLPTRDLALHSIADAPTPENSLQSENVKNESKRSAWVDYLTLPVSGRWWSRILPDTANEERLRKGYILILPGIEGQSYLNVGIMRGLLDAEEQSAIEIYDWTTGYWPLLPYHLRALKRNRDQARIIAEKIVAYQDRYPGRPVRLVGHSGGGAMALFALEALPADRQVDCALLLAPAISPRYDLTAALSHSDRGIWNFHSSMDVVFLGAGTLLLGNVDGVHASAAGASGFSVPRDLATEGQAIYTSHLHQNRYSRSMAKSLHLGGHTGWTNRRFVANWLAPLLTPRLAATDG